MHLPIISPPRQSIATSTPWPFSSSSLSTAAMSSFVVTTTRSAFKCLMLFAISSVSTVVITLTPKAFAIGIITLARPLAPAFIKRVFPAFILPSINRFKYAVANASGIAAASTIVQFSGTGISISHLTFAYSA